MQGAFKHFFVICKKVSELSLVIMLFNWNSEGFWVFRFIVAMGVYRPTHLTEYDKMKKGHVRPPYYTLYN